MPTVPGSMASPCGSSHFLISLSAAHDRPDLLRAYRDMPRTGTLQHVTPLSPPAALQPQQIILLS